MNLANWLTTNLGLITAFVGLITMVAIILAPIIALWVQKKIERFNEKQQRKVNIFKTLMATRAAKASIEHVQALNMIDIEFYNHTKIIESWKVYLDHLNSYPLGSTNEIEIKSWINRGEDLLTDLLFDMSEEVGYHFDKVTLKKGIYWPQAHSDLDNDQYLIRKGLIKFLHGEQIIPIYVMPPIVPNANETPVEVHQIKNAQHEHVES